MENFYDAVVEPDGRIRLNASVRLQRGLKVVVAVPRSNNGSALSGIALSEPSLSDDWLNPDEEEAWGAPSVGDVVIIPFPSLIPICRKPSAGRLLS